MLLVVGRNDMIARFLMNKFKRYVRVPRKSSMAYVVQVSSKCYEYISMPGPVGIEI